jgi:hypothetical protein
MPVNAHAAILFYAAGRLGTCKPIMACHISNNLRQSVQGRRMQDPNAWRQGMCFCLGCNSLCDAGSIRLLSSFLTQATSCTGTKQQCPKAFESGIAADERSNNKMWTISRAVLDYMHSSVTIKGRSDSTNWYVPYA